MEIVSLPIGLREINSDLRNSLTGIMGNAHLLDQAIQNPELKAFITDILASSNTLLQLTELLTKEAKRIN